MSGNTECQVLVIDDDPDFADSLVDILDLHGYAAMVANSAAAAVDMLSCHNPPVVMLDIRLGGVSGFDLISRLQAVSPGLICVMMTAHVDTPTAIQAMRQGAYDYIDKVCDPAELSAALDRAFETHQLRNEKQAIVEALREAKASAEAANQAKSDFLATMSHELRTPLNAVIGFSEMIMKEAMGPIGNAQYLDYVKDINMSGHHLLSIVNDILDLTKAEAGKLELSDDIINPRDAIAPPMRLLAQRASEGGLTLSAEIGDKLPLLRADERKAQQVLINLLSNAVKFTPRGGRIVVTTAERPEGLAIMVTDTGIGIAPGNIAKALEPFGQIENPLSRHHDGTGLGLPLVKSIMELHGGSMTLESEVGVGTTVTVTFPKERLVHPAHA